MSFDTVRFIIVILNTYVDRTGFVPSEFVQYLLLEIFFWEIMQLHQVWLLSKQKFSGIVDYKWNSLLQHQFRHNKHHYILIECDLAVP